MNDNVVIKKRDKEEGDKIASVFMPDSLRETNALGKPTSRHGDGTTEVGPCVGLQNVGRF
jgi:hypothetical protein